MSRPWTPADERASAQTPARAHVAQPQALPRSSAWRGEDGSLQDSPASDASASDALARPSPSGILPRDAPQLSWLKRLRRPDPNPSPAELQSRAQSFSVLCHMSVLFGLPMFIIPMIKRDHAFSLHHGKASAVNFIVFHLAMLASVTLHPAFLLGVLLSYLPAWAGIWRAARGQEVGWIGFGPLAEALFRPLLPSPPPAVPLLTSTSWPDETRPEGP